MLSIFLKEQRQSLHRWIFEVLVVVIFEYFEEDVHCKSIVEILSGVRLGFDEADNQLKNDAQQNVVKLDSQQQLQILEQFQVFKFLAQLVQRS